MFYGTNRLQGEFVNPKLMESIGLGSNNSIVTACAGFEAIIGKSLGENTLNPNSSRWMKSTFEDTNLVRQNQGAVDLEKAFETQRLCVSKEEMIRMASGKEAAESAMKVARDSGGDFTIWTAGGKSSTFRQPPASVNEWSRVAGILIRSLIRCCEGHRRDEVLHQQMLPSGSCGFHDQSI